MINDLRDIFTYLYMVRDALIDCLYGVQCSLYKVILVYNSIWDRFCLNNLHIYTCFRLQFELFLPQPRP